MMSVARFGIYGDEIAPEFSSFSHDFAVVGRPSLDDKAWYNPMK